MKYSKELLKGSTSILVMSVLKDNDLYGYKIIRELEIRSENVFEMSEGTLYPILHALEKDKFLASYWEEVDGRRRKYYHLTEKGLKQFEEKKKEFVSYSNNVVKVLNFA
ncbi:MAG: PadR family transcriptional regulator [Clostridium sp.]|nr:PadR family transcriptional regulator [Clostridium sp.]